MTTNNTGGSVSSIQIDPNTGKLYTSTTTTGGTDISTLSNTTATTGTAALTPTKAATTGATIVVEGTPGPAGTNGTDGKSVLSGTTAPTVNDGNVGDFFYVPGTMTMYGPKSGSGWPTGIVLKGTNGTAGLGIASATVNGLGHLILTLSDNTTIDAGSVQGAPGTAGTNGTNGAAGTNGTNGAAGANGTNGVGFTSATIDVNGHLILTKSDTTTVDAGLVPTVTGTAGTNGKSVLSGTVDPQASDGTNGDFWINYATLTIFGPKGTPSAGWTQSAFLRGTAAPTITSAAIDGSDHLVFTLSDTTTVDAGLFPGIPAPSSLTTLPADATDLASAITLANATKALLISLGLAKS